MGNWYDIPPHHLILRGYDDCRLELTVDAYVAEEPNGFPHALGVKAEVSLPSVHTLRTPFTIHLQGYCDLGTLRRQLGQLVRTGEGIAGFQDAGLSWTISPLASGSGDELLVEGKATSFIYVGQAPWPKNLTTTLRRHGHEPSAGCRLQFAFLTSRIAEAWLHDFATQLDDLNNLLGLW